MTKISPTQKSLKELRSAGYIAQVVEKWNPFAKVRQDLFGVIDIVAVHPDLIGVLGVQCTTKAHIKERLAKANAEPKLQVWLKAKNRFVVHGWEKNELVVKVKKNEKAQA